MARSFNGTTQYGEYAGAVLTAIPLTLAAWCFMATSKSGSPLCIAASGTTFDFFGLFVQGTASGVQAATGSSGASSAATTTAHPSAGVWFHVCGVFAAAASRTIYLNGGSPASNAGSRTPASLDRTSIARRANSSPANVWGGLVADAAVWSDTLTASEVAALAAGVSPLRIRPASLVDYWPLQGIDSPERSWVSGGHAMTLTASPTLANHAPVEPYSRRFWGSAPLIEVAAGGAPHFRRSSFGRAGSRGAYA